jgi:hypothetical protein
MLQVPNKNLSSLKYLWSSCGLLPLNFGTVEWPQAGIGGYVAMAVIVGLVTIDVEGACIEVGGAHIKVGGA